MSKTHGNRWAGVAPTNRRTRLKPGVYAPGTHEVHDLADFCFETREEAAEHVNRLIDAAVQRLESHRPKSP